MSGEVAVVGDIHGNPNALAGMLRLLNDWTGDLVFTGDYVNRGPDPAGVVQILVDLSATRPNTYFVAGNHDVALRAAIASANVFPLLAMGGAPTIKSYVQSPKGNVGEQLRTSVPPSHIEFLDDLRPWFMNEGLVVAHDPNDPIFLQAANRYRVHGHVPTADRRPDIGEFEAAIDTGCGSSFDGRLTCFFWPACAAKQVDHRGVELAG